MGIINIKIDGKPYSVDEKLNILEAAKLLGIHIPSLCYHPDLPPSGSCGLCIVKARSTIGGVPKIVRSCVTPVANVLEIWTNDDELQEIRKTILEMILSEHPTDCMTCDASGNCELEKIAYELKVKSSALPGKKTNYPCDTSNPFFIRDYNKCILCGRCISACSEEQFNNAIAFSNRGEALKITTSFNNSLLDSLCESCGRCITVCPTAALIEKERQFAGREWELKKVRTVCPYCGCGCELELNIKDNKIIKVQPAKKPNGEWLGVNKGNLCVKGKFGFDFVSHPDRLRKPLMKKQGKLCPVDWEEALSFAAEKLKEIKDKYGSDSIAGLSSAKCTNEDNYLFQKFMRVVIGTNNIDHCARLCHAPTLVGLTKAFGSGAMTNSISEFEKAKCIFVIGSNISETHPIIALQIKKAVLKNGAKLIVADPRKIDIARFATIYIQQKPGTDVALINGMMNVILKEHLENLEFLERTENFDELKKVVRKYDPEKVEKITAVPKEKITEAALLYATSRPAAIIFTMGITQHTTGTANVLSLANLAMLTGNVGIPSSGVNPLRGQNNVQGACDMGALPDLLPGYQSVADKDIRRKFEGFWHQSIPSNPGLTITEMMQQAKIGKIKGMVIMGENPALSDPNTNELKKALQNLEFLLVQDIFLSETAEYADIILPAASFAEKEGTFTNTERRVQRVRKAFEPPGLAKSDWEIICQMSQKMGYEMKYTSPAEIMEEIASITPIYGGLNYQRLDKDGIQWPCPNIHHPGTPILHREKFTRGKGLFCPTEFIPPKEMPDRNYPFILTTGRILYHYHTGTMTRRTKGLEEIRPEGIAEINPVDAEKLGLRMGDQVKISSRRGEIITKIGISDKPGKGVIFMNFHFKEVSTNLLTNDAIDPVAKIPEFKVCAVRIDRVPNRVTNRAPNLTC